MKRTALFISIFVLSAVAVSGVFAADGSSAYRNGAIVFQAGVGYGYPGSAGSTTIPPLIASVEYQALVAPKVPLSFGALGAYAASDYSIPPYTWKYSDLIIGGRAAFHFGDLLNFKNGDLYGGLMIGYDIVSVTAPSAYAGTYTVSASGITWGFYGGIRYFFSSFLGIYAELGYNIGYVNAGISLKF